MCDLPIRPEAVEAAAKARWEAACTHHRAEGKEHPTWDEVGTGEWAPYPKDLLLAWERAAIAEFCRVEGLTVETKEHATGTSQRLPNPQQRLVGKWHEVKDA